MPLQPKSPGKRSPPCILAPTLKTATRSCNSAPPLVWSWVSRSFQKQLEENGQIGKICTWTGITNMCLPHSCCWPVPQSAVQTRARCGSMYVIDIKYPNKICWRDAHIEQNINHNRHSSAILQDKHLTHHLGPAGGNHNNESDSFPVRYLMFTSQLFKQKPID